MEKRKRPRLKHYDYSQAGYYFITISVAQRLPVLSRVGRGLAPAEPPTVSLTAIGHIAYVQLMSLPKRYPNLQIDRCVMMPDHIHMILCLEETAGASPRPTVPDIIGAYKSLTTRAINQAMHTPGKQFFQPSFYEHIIRSEASYIEICRYLDENPQKWLLRK